MKGFVIITIILVILLLTIYNSTKSCETFDGPDVSTGYEQSTGASEYYDWGYKPIPDQPQQEEAKSAELTCPKCQHVYLDNNICNIVIDDRHQCRQCDITKNKDIGKYVLKSSVPPCPDLSKFATKEMVKAGRNMNDYVLKSSIKPCNCADMSRYVLKSEIPACPKLPKCPICPICPRCPKCEEYPIEKHKDVVKYIYKDECERYKKSLFTSLEDWVKSKISPSDPSVSVGKLPYGYGFGYTYGYGLNNPGYGLSGNKVTGMVQKKLN